MIYSQHDVWRIVKKYIPIIPRFFTADIWFKGEYIGINVVNEILWFIKRYNLTSIRVVSKANNRVILVNKAIER